MTDMDSAWGVQHTVSKAAPKIKLKPIRSKEQLKAGEMANFFGGVKAGKRQGKRRYG